MAKSYCQCQYCGKEWEQVFYGFKDSTKCPKCGDKRVKIRKQDGRKVNYYEDDSATVGGSVKADYGEYSD